MKNIKVVHIIDSKGLNACASKVPSERSFDFSFKDRDKITCKSCKSYLGKPYFS